MKGFVLRFGRNKYTDIKGIKEKLRVFFKRRGVRSLLLCMFLLGLTAGAAFSGSFEENTLNRLDMLFLTNISARQSMSAFDIFISCFVSCFLFIFAAFLSSLSAWGFLALPLISSFNGFTVGLTTAFIIMKYQLPGVGFYILVILPGAVLFLYNLIRYSASGIKISLLYTGISLYGEDTVPDVKIKFRQFIRKTVFACLLSGICAVIDMILWSVFADKFDL